MKRTGVFIVLACGILFSATAFADNHTNKKLDLSPGADPKLGAALLAYEHRDFKKARSLLTPVATRGEVQAQFILGRIYALGLATKKDANEAEKWYRKAAEQGHTRAQFRLAMILDSKKQKRYKESLALLRKAAKAGHARAQFWLATKYTFYNEAPHSVAMWRYWVRKSAYQGDSYARMDLAQNYFVGIKLPKDPVLALMWTILAAKSGHPGANTWNEIITERITPKQIREAKRLVKLW